MPLDMTSLLYERFSTEEAETAPFPFYLVPGSLPLKRLEEKLGCFVGLGIHGVFKTDGQEEDDEDNNPISSTFLHEVFFTSSSNPYHTHILTPTSSG